MSVEKLLSLLPAGRVEYHRNGLALLPKESDPDPGLAFFYIDAKTGKSVLGCNCTASKKNKGKSRCSHIKQMSDAVGSISITMSDEWFDSVFRNSVWYKMASALYQACPVKPGNLTIKDCGQGQEQKNGLKIYSAGESLLTEYLLSPGTQKDRICEKKLLLERTGIADKGDNIFHRGRVIDMLAGLTLTESERVLAENGRINRRQALEQSFWYRLLYHFYTVSQGAGASVNTGIEESTGHYMICCRDRQRAMRIAVPSEAVMHIKKEMEKLFPDSENLTLWPESLESIVRVSADENNGLQLTLYLLLHLPDGSTRAIERRQLKKYHYNNAVYIPEQKALATWKSPDRFGPAFKGRYTRKIKPQRLPEVIDKMGDIFSPPNIIDDSAKRLTLYRQWDRIEIEASALERDWCWLSVYYGFGENVSVRLSDIYNARAAGQKYLAVKDGWVDVRALDQSPVLSIPGNPIYGQLAEGSQVLKLTRTDLIRLQAGSGNRLQIFPDTRDSSRSLAPVLELRPSTALDHPEGMKTSLRSYQNNGFQWLGFLHENCFGGLLCDEMGLGKTHQVMAMMVWLAENKQNPAPCLVVCPTTVISHWDRKIREHAPGLTAVVYHGTDRQLDDLSIPGTVLITSYGILLRDVEALKKIDFSLAAFDEAHVIKNPGTKSYGAACAIKADLKISVTGTPVENRIGDLKALMDLVMPGYLGSDHEFEQRYDSGSKIVRRELQQLIGPFTLRRTKQAVLDELPEKIEDIRYCRLTDTQVSLYRDALAGRGRDLRFQLESDEKNIPYIHIFALLTLLKQICNHPASIEKNKGRRVNTPDLSAMESGKWELFTELLETCLENGQKVVVFSQFVSMIRLILSYLESLKIGTASITGQTSNRGREIERFNDDPKCRVFVGSLKAGGSGIDLTGGSVVIHYDRWWNAAKEDQATDRVHRIGQKRGVQVFKLVTEGTLEEKIAAIIDRKKSLMADVIAEDDPGVLKRFTRGELMDLISFPDSI
jgi:superfamily II DNA or RNA helicase